MTIKTYNVLIIGTKNSTRSIMAEALFNTRGEGNHTAYSAGYSPTSVVNRFAVEETRATGYLVKKLNSKVLEAFLQPKALSWIL